MNFLPVVNIYRVEGFITCLGSGGVYWHKASRVEPAEPVEVVSQDVLVARPFQFIQGKRALLSFPFTHPLTHRLNQLELMEPMISFRNFLGPQYVGDLGLFPKQVNPLKDRHSDE